MVELVEKATCPLSRREISRIISLCEPIVEDLGIKYAIPSVIVVYDERSEEHYLNAGFIRVSEGVLVAYDVIAVKGNTLPIVFLEELATGLLAHSLLRTVGAVNLEDIEKLKSRVFFKLVIVMSRV